jgi:hypothetical protein
MIMGFCALQAEWDVHLLLNVDNCDVIFQDCSYLNTSPFVEA